MPRLQRIISPGALVHVVTRFVNKEFRITHNQHRREYLGRLGRALSHSDWQLLSYALMSSHIHLTLVAGEAEFWSVFKGVHSGFANSLNRQQSRLGPVFADRPKSIIVDPLHLARLIAYQHNNVVRAGLVDFASQSNWTSHPIYLANAPCPKWLNIELGLLLCEFGVDKKSRRGFDDFVKGLAGEAQDAFLSGDTLKDDYRILREQAQTAIVCSYPTLLQNRLVYTVKTPSVPWQGNIEQILDFICEEEKINKFLLTASIKNSTITMIKRLVILVARNLGFSLDKIGFRLGLSRAGVSYLEKGADKFLLARAKNVADSLLLPLINGESSTKTNDIWMT